MANAEPKYIWKEGIPELVSKNIEYLKCRANLNFEVEFRSNDAIGTLATWWDCSLFGK